MTLYYAHCMDIYNTPQETLDIVLLEILGFQVLNPNCEPVRASVEHAKKLNLDVMEYVFKPLVQSCDALAFRGANCGGRISAGVAQEIQWAEEKHGLIIEIPHRPERRFMSLEETRDYLKSIGLK